MELVKKTPTDLIKPTTFIIAWWACPKLHSTCRGGEHSIELFLSSPLSPATGDRVGDACHCWHKASCWKLEGLVYWSMLSDTQHPCGLQVLHAGSPSIGYYCTLWGFCCGKGSAMRETEFDWSYILASLIVSQRIGKQPKVAPAERLAPYKNDVMPPSLCPSAVCPWKWGLAWMHRGSQGRMTERGSGRQLLCFRFQQ